MSEKFKLKDKPTIKELPLAAVITTPATSRFYKTGDWRSSRPEIDKAKCIGCGLCWIYCPHDSIIITEKGDYEVNLEYCKGCGICAEECPAKAITMVEEVEV